MAKLIRATILLCLIAATASAQFPAPMLKQLKISYIGYRAPDELNDTWRTWLAQRYAMKIGGSNGYMVFMRTVNPNMKMIDYGLYSRYGTSNAPFWTEDTTTLRNWCISKRGGNVSAGAAFMDSLVYRTGATSADSSVTDFWNGLGTQTTAGGGKLVLYRNYTAASLRYAWDFRRPVDIANYLYANNIGFTSSNSNGVMMDEEGVLACFSPAGFPGNGSVFPPWLNKTSQWPVGFYNVKNPWSPMTDCQMADSLFSLALAYATVLGDSARAHGKLLMPNFAAYGWHNDPFDADFWGSGYMPKMFKAYGGGGVGEAYGYNAGGSNAVYGGNGRVEWAATHYVDYWINTLTTFPSAGVSFNSNDNLWIGWIGHATYDVNTFTAAGVPAPLHRVHMNMLGFFLDLQYPAGPTVWYQMGQFYNGNDYAPNSGNPNLSLLTGFLADTTANWDYTWGKYFGTPTMNRDTAQRGTNYAVRKFAFMKPGSSTGTWVDTLTFVIGRYARLNTWNASTAVNVTMPGTSAATYYELRCNRPDTAGLGNNVPTIWGPAVHGGDLVPIENGQWKIFTTDKALADNGTFVKTIDISNAASVTEGGQQAYVVNRNWSTGPVTVFYKTVDGSGPSGAVAPGDYVAQLSGQLTIPDGFSSGTIFVLTNTDALLEPTETNGVHLQSTTDGVIGVADATGPIIDGTTAPPTTTAKKIKIKRG